MYPHPSTTIKKKLLDFVKCFLCIYWGDHSVLCSVNMLCDIEWILDANSALYSWNKSHLVKIFLDVAG
jgi:hypothetical protein